jgi:uncharacterized membrane protein
MLLLTIDAVLWLGLHLGVAGTDLRYDFTRRLGVNGYRGLFSVLSIVVMVLFCNSYAQAGTIVLWEAPPWLRWVLAFVMLPAFVLFAASFVRNPTAAGGEKFLKRDVQGIQRVTRHPMMVSYAIWAAVHMIGNGDAASLLFFGTFLLTAVVGMPSIDRKTSDRDDYAWAKLEQSTSIVPFAAILGGRNQFVPREIGWVTPAVGTALWLGLLIFHRSIFGHAPIWF